MRYGEKASRQTKLALARKKLKKTQQDLAYESGVSLRSIQMYEQRQRNINEASVTSLRANSKSLHCNIEDLLEPVFEYKETSAYKGFLATDCSTCGSPRAI
ncbi:MAG: helix-turn-helix transcriptional regulator [Collinsella sp.]